LLCLAVMQVMLDFRGEARWLRMLANTTGICFSVLPQDSGYNKRLKAALPQIKRVIWLLAEDVDRTRGPGLADLVRPVHAARAGRTLGRFAAAPAPTGADRSKGHGPPAHHPTPPEAATPNSTSCCATAPLTLTGSKRGRCPDRRSASTGGVGIMTERDPSAATAEPVSPPAGNPVSLRKEYRGQPHRTHPAARLNPA
jgi:hypothetical protein